MAAIHDLIDTALAASNGDGCAVIAAEQSEANLRWAANSLTTNGRMRSRAVTVISVVDGARVGVVTRSVTTADEVQQLVADSEAAAKDAGPAPDVMPLVEPAGSDPGWDADPASTSIEVFDRFAADLGGAFRQWRGRGELLFGFAEHTMTSTFVATSTGLRRRVDQPSGRLELNAKSADFRRSAYAGVPSRQFTDIDVAAVADGLAQRLRWAEKSVELPAGRYETILPPSAVADLLIDAYWAMSARDAEEGRSVFSAPTVSPGLRGNAAPTVSPGLRGNAAPTVSPGLRGNAAPTVSPGLRANAAPTVSPGLRGNAAPTVSPGLRASAAGGSTRIGERLAALPLTLLSDPSYPGLEAADFEIATSSDGATHSVFDNGDPIARTEWIRAGVLTDLVRTRSWAAATGAEPRHFIGNLVLDGAGTASLEDMVANTERGLLLTCLWYIREVDPQTLLLTGLTRDGVYLVENGAVTGAVNNFRFNESPVDLLGRVSEAGRTERTLPREMSDYFTRVSMPPLRVPDFFMSTVSPAS